MNTLYFLSAFLQNAGDGSPVGGFLGSMPRDPASIFALLLIVGGAAAVMWYGRPKGGGGTHAGGPQGGARQP